MSEFVPIPAVALSTYYLFPSVLLVQFPTHVYGSFSDVQYALPASTITINKNVLYNYVPIRIVPQSTPGKTSPMVGLPSKFLTVLYFCGNNQ